MDTGLLTAFLTLAETKNFTAASKRLYRTQSAISLQIAKLESMFERKFFVRNNRNVSLTPDGEELIGFAKTVLAHEKEMFDYFLQTEIQGEVRFGTPEDLATIHLPIILSQFTQMYRKVLLHVECQFTVSLLEGFEGGRYDVVLIKEDPDLPHKNSRKVWDESLVWISQKNVDFEKMEEIPLILAPAPCVYRERALEALKGASLRSRIVYTSPSLTGALAAVRAGLGVSVLPLSMLDKDLKVVSSLPALKNGQIALLSRGEPSSAILAFAEFTSKALCSKRLTAG